MFRALTLQLCLRRVALKSVHSAPLLEGHCLPRMGRARPSLRTFSTSRSQTGNRGAGLPTVWKLSLGGAALAGGLLLTQLSIEWPAGSWMGRWGKVFALQKDASLASVQDGKGSSLQQKMERELPEEKAQLAKAPNVPPPIQRRHPARVMVDLNVIVKELPIDDTSTYEFWTFEEAVPGPMIRARVGDLMQVRLTNRDQSGMYHNMDFHAVLGPGGGATVLNCSTDETKTATFKLTYPGLFIYHCAVDPVSVHIANGMYGLLLVEPEEGLPPAEKEYYVVQSELYTEDEPDTPNSSLLPFSIDRVMDERPNYVVFNGRVGAHLEDNPLKATVGDRVRMYVGNPGPNLVSSFHVIGTIFDKAYRDGSLVNEPARGLQTLMIPAGSAAIVELDALVPGTFTLVDHSISRIEKGCVGFLQVDGEARDPELFHSKDGPAPCPGCKIHP
ncbi:hypothetical protein CDCA_CDCA09G2636 [Cyanidium caldarium]|uniref:Copper-containing nitrite reductase n=1 Tax=Cyanidium caldarium TaxID=2771 RepID=A0AAV9IWW7_CYACA|nr:hypothetical protein CDCA_CDCA09G2636 [Cyanidium caldarium]